MAAEPVVERGMFDFDSFKNKLLGPKGVLTMDYWTDKRRRKAFVISTAFIVFSVMVGEATVTYCTAHNHKKTHMVLNNYKDFTNKCAAQELTATECAKVDERLDAACKREDPKMDKDKCLAFKEKYFEKDAETRETLRAGLVESLSPKLIIYAVVCGLLGPPFACYACWADRARKKDVEMGEDRKKHAKMRAMASNIVYILMSCGWVSYNATIACVGNQFELKYGIRMAFIWALCAISGCYLFQLQYQERYQKEPRAHKSQDEEQALTHTAADAKEPEQQYGATTNERSNPET